MPMQNADAMTERAAIMWVDSCECEPFPNRMGHCKCGARERCESEAARAHGVLAWDVNPAVRAGVRAWEDGLWV